MAFLKRLLRHWPVLLIALPPLLLLGCILHFHMDVPQGDSWLFLSHWVETKESGLNVAALFRPHGEHIIPVPRLLYYLAADVWGQGMWKLCLLAWAFTLAALVAVWRLARHTGTAGAVPLALGAAMLFSPSQGETWTWDFVFGNYLPGACTLGILVLQRSSWPAWLRWGGIVLCTLLAACSFRSGITCLVPPAVAALLPDGRPLRRRMMECACWLGAAALLVAVQIPLPEKSSTGGGIGALFQAPLFALQFFTVLCGLIFAWTGAAEPALMATCCGVVFLGLFAWCAVFVLRRGDHALTRAAAPWIGLASAGILNAALITVGRLSKSIGSALAERYITLTLFLPLALCFLIPLVLRAGASGPAAERQLRYRLTGTVLATIAALLWLLSIAPGVDAMHWWQKRARQQAAAVFCHDWWPAGATELLNEPPGTHGWQANPVWRKHGLWQDLRTNGRSLDGWKIAAKPLPASRGQVARAFHHTSGELEITGMAQLPDDAGAPDLLVLTSAPPGGPESVLTACPPRFPLSWMHRESWRRRERAHYDGFTLTLPGEAIRSLPDGTVLRVLALDLMNRRLYPLPWQQAVKGGAATAG